jgi:hypothetical protein
MERVAELDGGISEAHSRRFVPAKFAADMKLEVPPEQLVAPRGTSASAKSAPASPAGAKDGEASGSAAPVGPDAAFVTLQSALQQVAQAHAKAERVEGSSLPQGDNPTGSFLSGRGAELLAQCVALVEPTTLERVRSDTWAPLASTLIELLQEVTLSQATATLLAEPQEALKRMRFSVEELSQQQQDAIEEGDMKAAELLYFRKITQEESMVPTFEQMFRRLEEHHQEAFVEPLQRAHAVHEKASADVVELIKGTEMFKTSVEGDLSRLAAAADALTTEDTLLRRRYRAVRDECDAYLASNLQQQDECYAQMEELERRLRRLSEDRTEALQRRVAASVEEARRAADYAHFERFCTSRRAQLEATLREVEVAEEVTDLFDEFLCGGCNAVERRMRVVEGEIDSLRASTHDQRLAQFRQLYLTLGDLQYKKERNIEELERKIEQAHIQQEVAMDTFNPRAKEFSELKKELTRVRDEMASQVQTISEKATLQIEYFKPTEEALVGAGRDFVHPVQELAEKNAQRQQKLLQYRTLMLDEAATKDPAPEVDVDAERRAIEQLRHSRGPRSEKSSPIAGGSAIAEL